MKNKKNKNNEHLKLIELRQIQLRQTADNYIKKAQHSDAIPTLLEILKLNKENAYAYTQLGIIFYNTGSYLLCIQMHNDAITYGANHPDNYFQRGFSYTRIPEKNYKKALEDFLKAKELSNNPSVNINIAVCYRNLAHYQLALYTLQNINPMDKNLELRERFIIYINYAHTYFNLGNEEESIKYFMKAEELFKLDSHSYEAIEKLSANIDFRKGVNYLLEKNYQEAVNCLKKSNESGGLVGRELGIAYQEQGNLLEADGNLPEASKNYLDASNSYDKIIEELTNKKLEVSPRHYYERGLINLKLNTKLALEDFKSAKEKITDKDSIKIEEVEEQINKINRPMRS